jgi:uncharacterized protein YggU (UPF0235/DUF167 family)
VVGRHGSGWKIKVSSPAEHGRANDAVVALLASSLGLHRRDVAVLSGHSARDKVVSVSGIESAELEQRLGLAAGQG